MNADSDNELIPLVDSHCHLDFPEILVALPSHLARCSALKIERIVIPAAHPERWDVIVELAARYPQVWMCLGVHPWYADKMRPADWARLERLCQLSGSRLVAIGECGLDRLHGSQEDQLPVFLKQIHLACALKKPLVIHAVRCHAQVLSVLRTHAVGLKGVIHGFSGSLEEAQAYVRHGFLIGVGAQVTYEKSTRLRKIVAALPARALLLETDAPDQAVMGFSRGAGRPQHVEAVWRSVAALRDDRAGLRVVLYDNAAALFGWPWHDMPTSGSEGLANVR